MTQSFVAASVNMEENKRLMLIQYICFLSGHEVMIKTDKGKKGGVPPKTFRFFFYYYLFCFVLFKEFYPFRSSVGIFTRLCF